MVRSCERHAPQSRRRWGRNYAGWTCDFTGDYCYRLAMHALFRSSGLHIPNRLRIVVSQWRNPATIPEEQPLDYNCCRVQDRYSSEDRHEAVFPIASLQISADLRTNHPPELEGKPI